MRNRRNGDHETRFMSFVQHDTNGGCWLWSSYINKTGYGTIFAKGKMHMAHRASYQLFKGEIPDGMLVLHSCDVKPCVNPAHLRLGTHRENMADASSRRRFRAGKARPPLSQGERRAISDLRGLSTYEIARRVGVSRTTVRTHLNKDGGAG